MMGKEQLVGFISAFLREVELMEMFLIMEQKSPIRTHMQQVGFVCSANNSKNSAGNREMAHSLRNETLQLMDTLQDPQSSPWVENSEVVPDPKSGRRAMPDMEGEVAGGRQ